LRAECSCALPPKPPKAGATKANTKLTGNNFLWLEIENTDSGAAMVVDSLNVGFALVAEKSIPFPFG
jgi:hypothetical protein